MVEEIRQTEDVRLVKDIVQTILKAKKTIRMYPENNPIYLKTVDDLFLRFREFLDYRDALTLRIRQYDILFDTTPVYSNPEKEDNLALFFFKDGLRELSFLKGLFKEEVEEFLKIIALDFDREAVDDDIVTLLWERDFQNIKYVADEEFLTEDEGYEEKATNLVKGRVATTDEIMKAYTDAFLAEGVNGVSIVNLTDKDLQALVKEMEDDIDGKIEKVSDILFEMLHHVENQGELEDIYRFIRNTMTYSLEQGNLPAFIHISRGLKKMEGESLPEGVKKLIHLLLSSINSEEMINFVGEIFDINPEIDEELLLEYKELLDKSAIPPLISVLGRLKSIQGRKRVINILVDLGRKDIQTLAKGLYDSRWYVVRNILYILRQIGDKKAVEYLINTVRHPDSRVRREAIKAIGELKNPLALQLLKDCLSDYDSSIRKTAVRALSNFGSETAKRIIMGIMVQKDFLSRDFDEKKEFYEALSKWNDDEVRDFLIRILKKRSLFRKARHDENKACAAYCLGFVGNRESLPVLERLRDSKNNLIREYANFAIRKIEYERR